MAILVQFNENDNQRYKDILTATNLAETILKPQLALLVKAKVLLQDDDVYELNLSEFLDCVLSSSIPRSLLSLMSMSRSLYRSGSLGRKADRCSLDFKSKKVSYRRSHTRVKRKP